jgi:hypothetical protein
LLRRHYAQKETQRNTHRDTDVVGKNGTVHEDGKSFVECEAHVLGESDCVGGSVRRALGSDSLPTTRSSITRSDVDAIAMAWEWGAKNERDGIKVRKVGRDRQIEIDNMEHKLKLNGRGWGGKCEARAILNVSENVVKIEEDSEGEGLSASDFDASLGSGGQEAVTPRKIWGQKEPGSLLGGSQDCGDSGELDSDSLGNSMIFSSCHWFVVDVLMHVAIA